MYKRYASFFFSHRSYHVAKHSTVTHSRLCERGFELETFVLLWKHFASVGHDACIG